MAKFNDLSVDLVYVIFSHLQSDKLQLHWLALSCRLFRDISQRFMVRNASISHSIRGSRTQLFLRTLTERPDLVAHVHRLELDLLREDVHWPEEQQTIHQLTRLLTNLREFCYLSSDYKVWHFSIPTPLKWRRTHAHDQVRRVDWHHNMTPWDLRKCMQLPRIESIYVRELVDPIKSFKIPERIYKTSTLVELRIGVPTAMNEKAFQPLGLLLNIPVRLKRILFESHVWHNPIFNPAALMRLLHPVRDTLEELRVDIWENRLDPFYQPADLSNFISLKKLAWPMRFLFGSKADPLDHTEINLPPNLNKLEMAYKSGELRFAEVLEAPTSKVYPTFINWLEAPGGQHDISTRMPLLTCITFMEHDGVGIFPDLNSTQLQELTERSTSQNAGLPKGRPEFRFISAPHSEGTLPSS
ncbi:hypothetical protein GRF29_77g1847263 [Pseudopithomyces chartarum]|uniref:F-box domain-containing protein n=1 Tax=Pseudopithomyces chartarum TaxID=1892770 RepID=A0AAN6RGQ1_9PLEO|nr:hypothetical protein GRF29_77g1847263 [Pseudopithomyces chartarum]